MFIDDVQNCDLNPGGVACFALEHRAFQHVTPKGVNNRGLFLAINISPLRGF